MSIILPVLAFSPLKGFLRLPLPLLQPLVGTQQNFYFVALDNEVCTEKEGIAPGRVSASGALPSCDERTPPGDPAALLASVILFLLYSRHAACIFQSGQIGCNGAQIVFGYLKAGQFRVIALDKPELSASLLMIIDLIFCFRVAERPPSWKAGVINYGISDSSPSWTYTSCPSPLPSMYSMAKERLSSL